MQIHKFGGACTATRERIDRIVEIIKSRTTPVVLTVSASSGITKYLIEILEQEIKEIFVPAIISQLQNVHQELRYQNTPLKGFNQDLHKLERLLYGIIYTEEITDRSRDLVISFGERLISWVIKERFQEHDITITYIDPTDLIVTDGTHFNSRILLKETEDKCRNYLSNENLGIAIIPGYYGASKNNVTTLLGRSGTDYSATALAYGFNASSITVWKDVEGFMTSDPRLVSSARTIRNLSYEEAAELAHFGAVILHPTSVIPAKLKEIPIWVKNFYNDEISTQIHTLSSEESTVVKSVSHLSDLTIVRIYVSSGGHTQGIFSKLASALDLAGSNIYSIATSQTCISVLLKSDEVEQSVKSITKYCGSFVDHIEQEYNIALLCIVGLGLGNTPGVASRVFQAVAKENVNVGMISSGASKAAYHFTVSLNDLSSALNAVHNEFF